MSCQVVLVRGPINTSGDVVVFLCVWWRECLGGGEYVEGIFGREVRGWGIRGGVYGREGAWKGEGYGWKRREVVGWLVVGLGVEGEGWGGEGGMVVVVWWGWGGRDVWW